jgi:hypothetical protein
VDFIKALVVADVNGDGRPDIIDFAGGVVNVLLGNGDGTFQNPLTIQPPVDGRGSASPHPSAAGAVVQRR